MYAKQRTTVCSLKADGHEIIKDRVTWLPSGNLIISRPSAFREETVS
ncbi:BQ5605_C033g11155 [Microbotryum silenes-dioicae]|uniref:BQ5605_C033g11155 protein n=1 Tax=Microbotryum silenes-dioicae TaxID=796604 RepID=A0A2X0MKP0_9BASI|nr:BQ5605_C033g11155 [Microbotryum silenes-dioicae]